MSDISYPVLPRNEADVMIHGHRVSDPYRVLEDFESPVASNWLRKEDEIYRSFRKKFSGRDALGKRFADLVGVGYVSTPIWRGDFYFYLRRTGVQEHPVLYRVDPAGNEQAIVDPIHLDPTGRTTLDAVHPSRDGRKIACQLSVNGTENATLWVLDIDTLRPVDGPIAGVRHSRIAWLPTGDAFYYTRSAVTPHSQEGGSPYRRHVWLHTLGTPASQDALVFGTGSDERTVFDIVLSPDGRWLVITSSVGSSRRRDSWLADLAVSSCVSPLFSSIQVGIDSRTIPHVGHDGLLYLRTDRHAERCRLCVCDPQSPDFDNWETVISERPDAVLTDYAILGEETVLCSWRKHAVSEVTRHDRVTGDLLSTVELPGVGSIGKFAMRPSGGRECWFIYSDYVTPGVALRYDSSTDECIPWKQVDTISTSLNDVETEQVIYRSRDGTSVRMFLVARRAATRSAPRPAMLFGYGGFGRSMTPSYSAGAAAWVEAGGVYAVAAMRGGGEEGNNWHTAGSGPNKQKSVDDLIAAGEWLVRHKWTQPDMLAVTGASNGGLIVGAALTQAPTLFRAVVCSSPLLDMIRYAYLGMGRSWLEEYGSPESPEQFDWLIRYSPYHQVREGVCYPAMLLTVSDSDTRVSPAHAYKMCAALQNASAADPATHPVLLRVERNAGHSPARALSRSIRFASDTLGFCAWATGLDASSSIENQTVRPE